MTAYKKKPLLPRLASLTLAAFIASAPCLATGAAAASEADDSAKIAAWVRRVGKHDANLPGEYAKVLGLSDGSDVRIVLISFVDHATGLMIQYGLLPGRPEVVVSRREEENNVLVFWLMKDGQILKTAWSRPNDPAPTLHLTSNDTYRQQANAMVAFFLKKATEAASKSEGKPEDN
jgi:hypothetical protein